MLGSRIAYALCMLAAVVLGGWLVRRRQQAMTLDGFDRWGLAIGGLIGATFAAKAPFVIGAESADAVWGAWLSDGKTVLWALVGGYVGVELAKWALCIRGSTGDSFVVGVASAVAVGRLGCLLFGCCYGIETDQTWGIRFVRAPDAGSLLRHPAQLYELVFHAAFAIVASWGIRKRMLPGAWMPLYLVTYAGFRFISEWWRPEPIVAGWLTFYQWSCLIIAPCFAVVFLTRILRPPSTELSQSA